jgi:hypothetical protein
MKKILVLSSVLIGVVFLAGCGQQPVNQNQPTTPDPVTQSVQTNSELSSKQGQDNTKILKNINYYKNELDKCLAETSKLYADNSLKEAYYDSIEDCKIASETSDDNPACYLEAKDGCYAELGEKTGDLKYCEKVETLQEREKWCYYEIGFEYKNSEACDRITTENLRNSCFIIVAYQTGNKDLCNKILNEKQKRECMDTDTGDF